MPLNGQGWGLGLEGMHSLVPRPTLQHWMYVSQHQHAQEGLLGKVIMYKNSVDYIGGY